MVFSRQLTYMRVLLCMIGRTRSDSEEAKVFASIFGLLLFSAALIWVGSLYRNRTDSLDYHLAGRRVGVGRLAASTFTLIGGGEFVTLTALAYWYRGWALVFFVGIALGFLAFSLLVGRARSRASEEDLHSLPDYFALHFGRVGSISSTILASLALGALLLIQLVVGGLMLGIVTGLPVSACIVGMAFVIGVYVYVGGFNSVLTTDVVQAVVMLGVLLLILVAYRSPIPAGAAALPAAQGLPPQDALVLIAAGFFAVIGGSDVWQRVLSARDDRAAARGLQFNAVGCLVFGALVILLALKILSANPEADPNGAFFIWLEGGLPQWLGAMTALLLFSALLSTADTEAFLLSVMLNKELSRRKGGGEIATRVTKLYVLGVVATAAVLALVFQQLVEIYFVLLYIMMILGPVSLARLLGRGSPAAAAVGIFGGAGVLAWLAFAGLLTGSWPLLIMAPGALSLIPRGITVEGVASAEVP